MENRVVDLKEFNVVGYRIETNLKEFASRIGRESYEKLLTRQDDISNKKNVHTILIQIPPKKEGLNP